MEQVRPSRQGPYSCFPVLIIHFCSTLTQTRPFIRVVLDVPSGSWKTLCSTWCTCTCIKLHTHPHPDPKGMQKLVVTSNLINVLWTRHSVDRAVVIKSSLRNEFLGLLWKTETHKLSNSSRILRIGGPKYFEMKDANMSLCQRPPIEISFDSLKTIFSIRARQKRNFGFDVQQFSKCKPWKLIRWFHDPR